MQQTQYFHRNSTFELDLIYENAIIQPIFILSI